ncbi:MAG: GDSL-type esterase/lipase family protein [Puniceicoccales bacterium]|nr:GDSL-type esterase/lipase family protein [Puniceicoccales bacterium]
MGATAASGGDGKRPAAADDGDDFFSRNKERLRMSKMRMSTKNVTRRGFLSGAGLATLAAAIAPRTAFAAETPANADIRDNAVPPAERKLTFLFQGDSITDGGRGRNLSDLNHHIGHGYVFAIVSRLGADFPSAGFKFHNRGLSGNKVSDLERRWKRDALNINPDVLSILIGVNDLLANQNKSRDAYDAATFEKKYRGILDKSRAANPNLLLVLAPPFMYKVGFAEKSWDFWGKETKPRAELVRKIAKDYGAVLVDYPAVFERAEKIAPIQHWTWDGCHPTVYAHELMAREWIKQVSTRLSFLKKYNY